MAIKLYSLIIFFILTTVLIAAPPVAYLLDTNGLTDTEEIYLIGTLQGIVNRDAPRLFLTNVNSSYCGGAYNTQVKYLETHKGFTFIKLKSLNDAIATFAALKGTDGKPLIKGMVKYQPTYWDDILKKYIDKYYNNWIAANMAAQDTLIAVTPRILNHQTQLLLGLDYWYKDTEMKRWSSFFVNTSMTSDGISFTPSAKRRIPALRFEDYITRYVNLDLAITPKVEIVISNLSPGGSWSFMLGMGSTVDIFNSSGGTKVPGLTNMTTTGTFVVDLAATNLFNPLDGRAQLKFCAMTQGTTVTVKSIRFLTASGQDPTTPLYVPTKNEFAGLTIKKDLTVSSPYADDSISAFAWSLANQRAKCDSNSFAHFSNGAHNLNSLDYVVANKIYIHYEKKNPFNAKTPYSNLDTILASLKSPKSVFGWIGDEDYSCLKMAEHGARYNGGAMYNGSFWKWVPYSGVQIPQARQVTTLENKVYVNYSYASADFSEFENTLMEGFWGDSARVSVPMTWGMSTFIAKNCPALMEYFAKTAKPSDSFWLGPSGDGYGHPASMSTSNMQKYANEVKRKIYNTGISPAVDFWDGIQPYNSVLNEFASDTPLYPGIKLLTILPNAVNIPKTYWLDNGTPIVRLDRGLRTWHKDTVSTVQSVSAAIQAAAAKLPENGPKFITCNIRFSPTFLKSVKELLPANFEVVGMNDFIGLAQDAGAMAIVPYSDGVGAGDSVKVSIELHNASGNTGGAGVITWNLPTGWTASPSSWTHGTVAKGANLKQIVTFKAPAGISFNGSASITFSDSRFTWNKELLLTTYPAGRTISDGDTSTDWTSIGGASISDEGGALKIQPAFLNQRYDYANGLRIVDNGAVSLPIGNVDFGLSPVLKINIPDQYSYNSNIGVADADGNYKLCQAIYQSGIYTIDLKSATNWTGVKSVNLIIDPATNYGTFVRLQSIKLCYSSPSTSINSALSDIDRFKAYKSNTDIVISGMIAPKLVEVFNVNGSKVFSKVMQNGSIPTFVGGVYLIRSGNVVVKVVV